MTIACDTGYFIGFHLLNESWGISLRQTIKAYNFMWSIIYEITSFWKISSCLGYGKVKLWVSFSLFSSSTLDSALAIQKTNNNSKPVKHMEVQEKRPEQNKSGT